jgi:hypothetical protein
MGRASDKQAHTARTFHIISQPWHFVARCLISCVVMSSVYTDVRWLFFYPQACGVGTTHTSAPLQYCVSFSKPYICSAT